MADAGMSAWESKFHQDLWRPITGIRESDPGTGPTGMGDGNPATIGDPNFTPFGAPASNLQGPNLRRLFLLIRQVMPPLVGRSLRPYGDFMARIISGSTLFPMSSMANQR